MPTEKKSLFEEIKKRLLLTFPETNAVEVGDLEEKGLALSLLVIFQAVFFTTLIIYSVWNISDNQDARFLVPKDTGVGMVCEEVPTYVDTELYIDSSGVWSTDSDFVSGKALYKFDLNQAKYNPSPLSSFNEQISTFVDNFKEAAKAGLVRDNAWNLVFAATYQETRTTDDGELMSGTARFSLTADAAVIFKQTIPLTMFANLNGYCMSENFATINEEGIISIDFKQRFDSHATATYAYGYGYYYWYKDNDNTATTASVASKPRASQKKQQAKPRAESHVSYYDYYYNYYYFVDNGNYGGYSYADDIFNEDDTHVAVDFQYDDDAMYYPYNDPIFIPGNICRDVANAYGLGYGRVVGNSQLLQNRLTAEVNISSVAVAIAVNYHMIPLSELQESSIRTPSYATKSIAGAKLRMRYYVHPSYASMDPYSGTLPVGCV